MIIDSYVNVAVTTFSNATASNLDRYVTQIVCSAAVSLASPPAAMNRIVDDRQTPRSSRRCVVNRLRRRRVSHQLNVSLQQVRIRVPPVGQRKCGTKKARKVRVDGFDA